MPEISDFTPDELKREHEYRRLEAEGSLDARQSAQNQADAWLAKINGKRLDNFSEAAKKDETK